VGESLSVVWAKLQVVPIVWSTVCEVEESILVTMHMSMCRACCTLLLCCLHCAVD
jgi:hypothetical protein